MNLFEKIQEIRVELKEKGLKQTGWNSYAEYSYFELSDFLTPLNVLMQKYKMTAIPSFDGVAATLTAINIENPEETWTISSPFGSAQLKGCHEVQNIGATETYQRRYLYQAMFDIAEDDALNKTQGKPQAAKQQSPSTNTSKQQTSQNTPKNEAKQQCEMCGQLNVTDKVANYSKEKCDGKVLCFDCQKKYNNQNKQQNKIEIDDDDLPF